MDNGPQPAAQAGMAQGAAAQLSADDVDRLVKQRLEQAFHGVFRKLVDTTERAAQAAEASASTNRLESLTKSLKVEFWKPASREEELKSWKEWAFQFTSWLVANDPSYEADLAGIDLEKEIDHALLPSEQEARSQRLFGVLCNVLKGRPLLLVKQAADIKNGLEAWRILRREMEPRERAHALAMVRQLAAWKFDSQQGLHEQLCRYEEALKVYESSTGKAFPEELVLATVVTGLKEPLRSQVQLQMQPTTKYSDIREWVLRYESLNAPWFNTLTGKGHGGDHSGAQPMDVDVIKGKWEKRKGKAKDSKGKKGKPGDGKGWPDKSWQEQEGA